MRQRDSRGTRCRGCHVVARAGGVPALSCPVRPSVVITGVGCVSPNGVGRGAFAEAMLAGRSGLKFLPEEMRGGRSSVAGIVDGFDPAEHMSPQDVRRVPRLVPMAVAAGREAMAQADLDGGPDVGVSLGTGGGGVAFLEEQYRARFTGGKQSPFAVVAGTHGNLASEVSIALGGGLRGPSHCLSDGCASSTDAIGHAADLIRNGRARAVLAGGADACIAPGVLAAFEAMKVVGTRPVAPHADPAVACRPFAADRDGFILGEGAWMFVLEAAEDARRRGAAVLAEVAGFGSTCDAFHRTQIAPDAAECVRAMRLALAEADVGPGDVDYVNLHGTGTVLNDKLETLALRKLLGEAADRVPMSTTKSLIGHPQGACGAAGVAATILCAARGKVHPTLNTTPPDPACDLDYVPDVAREHDVRVALCNCLAFGSKNSALVLKLPRASEPRA